MQYPPSIRQPLRRASTQNKLGITLQALGARQGQEGIARLEQAVTAYQEALKERTCDRVPLDWSTTQNGLGIALTMLGQREEGTFLLEQAVTAFQEALKEVNHENEPAGYEVA